MINLTLMPLLQELHLDAETAGQCYSTALAIDPEHAPSLDVCTVRCVYSTMRCSKHTSQCSLEDQCLLHSVLTDASPPQELHADAETAGQCYSTALAMDPEHHTMMRVYYTMMYVYYTVMCVYHTVLTDTS